VIAICNYYCCAQQTCQGGIVDAQPLPPSIPPIGAAVDVLGDRWTLLILHDMIVNDHRHFRALLTGSADGIASNILSDRLVKLLDAGLITRGTAMRGQRARYSLTEAGIRVVPVLVALGEWGATGQGGNGGGLVAGSEFVQRLTEELRGRNSAT
jgi:DNA-binding HxlR family transcriptional regulator